MRLRELRRSGHDAAVTLLESSTSHFAIATKETCCKSGNSPYILLLLLQVSWYLSQPKLGSDQMILNGTHQQL